MALRRKIVSAENALMRLEDLCARSERCEHELREKMRQWGLSNSDMEKVVDTLRHSRFFSDTRFAQAFVHDKCTYGKWGRKKIELALKAKRISASDIETALATIDPKEYENILLSLLKSKARNLKEGNTYEGRTKLYRFALSRGFEPSIIAQTIRSGAIFPTAEE